MDSANTVSPGRASMPGSWLRKASVSAIVPALLLTASMTSTVQAAESSTDLNRLRHGEVLVNEAAAGNSLPAVEAKILVPGPPSQVWSVVSNPEKLMQNEQKVKKVKVLSQTGNQQKVEFNVMMTRLLPAFNYVLLQELSPPHTLKFRRVSGSFRDIQGSWKLAPFENGTKTILTYTLKLDPGPLVPRTLLLNAVKSDLPTMMQNAKAAIGKTVR